MEFTCFLSCVFFLAGEILLIVYFNKELGSSDGIIPGGSLETTKHEYDRQYTRSLDGPYLQSKWEERRDHGQLAIFGSILIGFAWLFFTCPVIQLSYVLSKGGKRRLWLHTTMSCFALVTSCTEFFSTFLRIGTYRSADFIVTHLNLKKWEGSDDDFIGYKVLELTYRLLRGLNLWVDAFEFLALFFIFVLYFASIRNVNDTIFHALGLRLAGMGLFIGMLSLVDFAVFVLRLLDWRAFSPMAKVLTNVNRLVLLPLWLLIMSCRLPRAYKAAVAEADSEKRPALASNSAVLS